MQFDLLAESVSKASSDEYNPELGQWMTPAWAAEAIVAHALPNLPAKAVVLEPSCGIGRFLNALPDGVRAIGVEIDPRLADIARETSGAEIITGDFRTVDLPVETVDAIVGNPPFQMEVLDGMLNRARTLLEDGSTMTLILPAFSFQTTTRVIRWNRDWSISQDMLPRTLFPGIRLPLVLARFMKDPAPKLSGFLLYHETREVEEMPSAYRKALNEGRSGWKAVVEEALQHLGGEATISQIYAEIAPRRPTTTQHWREKVRQQLGTHFVRTDKATYRLAA